MNTIDFTKQGGFPFTQDTLDFMQREYVRMLNGIGTAWASSQGGQYVILSGCVDDGNGNISAGICSVNGEMMYCPGGSGGYVRMVESTQDAIFENGSVYPVYITRMLMFQTGTGQIAWSEFIRVSQSATSAQGSKADSAVQYATIGGEAVPKSGSVLQFPAFSLVDSQQDSAWQTPTINSSATGELELIRRNNSVFINAYISLPDGTVGADFIIATFPEKYRPSLTWVVPVFYMGTSKNSPKSHRDVEYS